MARYIITDDGLRPPQVHPVEAGKWYYLGASGSPKLVKVTRTHPDRFWYIDHYALSRNETKEVQIERWVGEDLISRASATMRKQAAEMAARADKEWADHILRIIDTHDLTEEEKQQLDCDQAENELRANHEAELRRLNFLYEIEEALRWKAHEAEVEERSMPRKFYKTVYTIVVLSEDKPIADDITLTDLEYLITSGPCSGQVEVTEVVEVDGPTMRELLHEQGSSAEFFMIEEEDAAEQRRYQ